MFVPYNVATRVRNLRANPHYVGMEMGTQVPENLSSNRGKAVNFSFNFNLVICV